MKWYSSQNLDIYKGQLIFLNLYQWNAVWTIPNPYVNSTINLTYVFWTETGYGLNERPMTYIFYLFILCQIYLLAIARYVQQLQELSN